MSAAPRILDVRNPADVASATAYHDPAWLVRRAWSSHRLPALQALIGTTIRELEALPAGDLLGQSTAGAEPEAHLPDPVVEALRACTEELRDACAMAGSQGERAAHCKLVRDYIARQPQGWGETFAAALEKYRQAACRVLLVAFHQPAVTR